MSVPDAKALSPAPVSTSTLMAWSLFAWRQISASRSYIANVKALRACGRLKVTRPIPSRRSNRMSLEAGAGWSMVVPLRRSAQRSPDRTQAKCAIWLPPPRSLHLDAGVADDLAPFARLVGDKGGRLLG